MPTPLVAGSVLADASLELKLQARQGAASPQLAAELHRGVEAREVQILVAVSILRWGYVTRELLKKYPWIPVQMLTPPEVFAELENSDAASAAD